jgi:hypothetical protein
MVARVLSVVFLLLSIGSLVFSSFDAATYFLVLTVLVLVIEGRLS